MCFNLRTKQFSGWRSISGFPSELHPSPPSTILPPTAHKFSTTYSYQSFISLTYPIILYTLLPLPFLPYPSSTLHLQIPYMINNFQSLLEHEGQLFNPSDRKLSRILWLTWILVIPLIIFLTFKEENATGSF